MINAKINLSQHRANKPFLHTIKKFLKNYKKVVDNIRFSDIYDYINTTTILKRSDTDESIY
jgi:hypothetical protein|nr:MAG TPA: hypothetical protein [Caudoviricetes sp.]